VSSDSISVPGGGIFSTASATSEEEPVVEEGINESGQSDISLGSVERYSRHRGCGSPPDVGEGVFSAGAGVGVGGEAEQADRTNGSTYQIEKRIAAHY
jgi:hypothetical protein